MPSLLDQKILTLLKEAKHILLLTDERLDGDTLGSTLGLSHVFAEMKKEVSMFSPKPIPDQFAFLPGVKKIHLDDSPFRDPSIDLVIISDCSDGAYINDFLPLMPRKVPLVMFDHHATNPKYGTYNVVEPEAASTADVVWRFVKRSGLPMNKEAAQCFLTGICTDTSIFTTANTTTACLEASADLAKYGAKIHEIVRHTVHSKSLPVLQLWGKLFERLQYSEEFDALVTALTNADMETMGNPEFDTSSISNFLNATLDEADVIIILRESDDGGVKASLRSRGRDVAAMAEKYGGGGHKLAAGFKVPNAHLEEKGAVWTIVKDKEKVEKPVAVAE